MDDSSPQRTDATPPQVCPGCGAPSRGRTAFCLRCGTRLPDATSVYLPIGKRTGAQAEPSAAGTSLAGVEDVRPAAQSASAEGTMARAVEVREDEATPPPWGAPVSADDAAPPPSASTSAPEASPAPPLPTEASATPRLGTPGAQVARAAIVHMDLEGRITGINPAAVQLFAVDEQQAMGLPYTGVFGASISNRLLRLFMQASKADEHGGLQEMHVKRPDGQVLALRASVTTQRDGTGAPIGFVFLAQGADPEADREPPTGTAVAAGTAPGAIPSGGASTLPGAASPVAPANAPAGVLRTISVLHAEVRGYTALSAVLPPTAVSALLSRYHRAAVAALQQAGATVDASVIGTILALWNGPEAQEDHARRALRGALALQAALGGIGGELRYAVGIHTGEAQVTNIGTAHAPLYSAVGLTVHIATSLQRQTEAGSISCSRVTLVAAGSGVRSTALGPLAIRGLERGVDAFAVLGVAP